MADANYSLTKLWPDFSLLFSEGGLASAEGLSAAVVLFLLAVAVIFFVMSVLSFGRARRAVGFYFELIQDLRKEDVSSKRRDILKEAESSARYGDLWKEFDESLVQIQTDGRLCNTLDAAHFFNTHTLSRGLTENRMTAAVPGFLTAIGVLGTFAGLQMGLAELDVSSEDIEALKAGIGSLIGGASIAFMTSVWGVLTSVIFNFLEKLLERIVRSRINELQNRLDHLYPRITAEQSLSNIENYTRQSTEKLSELDEKIGHKMQEAMREASAVISDSLVTSLSNLLGPAIDRLVDNAHSGSEKALEGLLDRFMNGMGAAGENQKDMLDKASLDFKTASADMTGEMQAFVSKLDGQMSDMMSRNQSMLEALEIAMKGRMLEQHQKDAARQESSQQQFESFMNSVAAMLQSVSTQTEAALAAMRKDQEKVSVSIDGVVKTQLSQHDSLISGMEQLLEGFSALTHSHAGSVEALGRAAEDLKASSTQFGLLSMNVKDAATALASKIKEATDQVISASAQNQINAAATAELLKGLESVSLEIQNTATVLAEAASKADHGLTEVGDHFNSLAESLEDHVASLNEKMQQMLDNYADKVMGQTQQRLNEWNLQTNNYTSAMTAAINALSGVVDDIETKIGTR